MLAIFTPLFSILCVFNSSLSEHLAWNRPQMKYMENDELIETQLYIYGTDLENRAEPPPPHKKVPRITPLESFFFNMFANCYCNVHIHQHIFAALVCSRKAPLQFERPRELGKDNLFGKNYVLFLLSFFSRFGKCP